MHTRGYKRHRKNHVHIRVKLLRTDDSPWSERKLKTKYQVDSSLANPKSCTVVLEASGTNAPQQMF